MGGDFADDFNQMLINDVCNLTANQITISPLLDNCSQTMNYNILQLGPIAAVNFIIRNVMAAMMDFIKNQASQGILYSSVFEDVDNYIYYLFNIFQLIEKKIITGMGKIADDINSSVSVIIVL